ncbi:MAG TPA: hypothetical protein VKB26_01870 [Candidatus Acidoferrales bacterium]|nr:hypothetical protein [Candidatus Acidoferrales bacterium]
MPDIEAEISAYADMREQLEQTHMGKWVLLHDRKLIGIFDSFDAAAEEAVKRFGTGPYLIRQVGAPPVSLPASVMYHLTHGKH